MFTNSIYKAPLFFCGAEGAWWSRCFLSMLPSAILSVVASRPPQVPIHTQFCLNQMLARWSQPGAPGLDGMKVPEKLSGGPSNTTAAPQQGAASAGSVW
ncbi:hypothetical protein E2C01_054919 [Portunus trituberculatus]|uniref:Uncharacterized protein n=1 Tax=Portunus trituberculatus TaxID=210409 RepID=A0A5B7GKX0_PORTR|nr:hypothetical protein [Portunus trituberculatus]